MADINMEGDVATQVFREALNLLPATGRAVAEVIARKKRRNQLTDQQLFNAATKKTSHMMNAQQKEEILKQAVKNCLKKDHGLPEVALDAYDLNIKPGRITLRFSPDNKKSIPLAFWTNKHKLDGKTIESPEATKQYTPLSNDEIASRIEENSKWLGQKQVYKDRIRELMGASNEQIAQIFKDTGTVDKPDFSNCEIHGYDFTNCDMSYANLTGAKLVGCKFGKMQFASMINADIRNCSFLSADLQGANFAQAEITDTNFENALLQKAWFDKAHPVNTNFGHAIFQNTNLDFRNPEGVKLNSEPVEVQASNIIPIGQENSGKYIMTSNFEEIYRNHRLWIETGGGQGRQADLRGAQLGGLNLSDKDLSGMLVNQKDIQTVSYNAHTTFPEGIKSPLDYAVGKARSEKQKTMDADMKKSPYFKDGDVPTTAKDIGKPAETERQPLKQPAHVASPTMY